MTVANCVIDMPLLSPGLIDRIAPIDRQGTSEASIGTWKCTLTEARQDEKLKGAKVLQQGPVHHRLSEKIFFVDILDEINLIDDIYKVSGLRNTPKYSIDTNIRSSIDSAMIGFQNSLGSIAELAGVSLEHSGKYPIWQPSRYKR